MFEGTFSASDGVAPQALRLTRNCEVRRESAACFLGTHDFTQFANLPSEPGMNGNPVKTLHRLDVVPNQNGIRFELEATGFLYRQVRHMVGALLVASPGHIQAMLEIGSSKLPDGQYRGWNAAPPLGLCLDRVFYPGDAR